MPDMNNDLNRADLPAKSSSREQPPADRRSARRAQLEQQAAERRRIYEFDEVARVRGKRLARRRRMLLWSAPVMLLALVVIVKALSVPIIAGAAQDKYASSDFEGARSSFHTLQTLNVAEKWKVHFNEGTAELAADKLDAAIATLFVAHGLAPAAPEDMNSLADGDIPPICAIQTNLAVAHELKGDVTQAVADSHVERMKREQTALDALGTDVPTDGTAPDPVHYKDLAIATYLESEALYRKANEIRVWNDCPDNTEANERNVEKETTAREKREALENPPPPPDGGGSGEDDPQDPQDPSDPSNPSDPAEGEPQPVEPTPSPEEQRQADLDARNKAGENEQRQTEDMVAPPGQSGSDTQKW